LSRHGEQALQNADSDPFLIFGDWLRAAEAGEPNDPNAMILATTAADGRPAARTVLLKAWDERGFVFYTNLDSRKSLEIKANPKAALLFFWKSLHRQIRIEGAVTPVSAEQADAYYASRPRGSRIGAWASAQSRPLPSRETFEAKLAAIEARFPGEDIPRPDFWSGWRVTPDYFEFWQDMQFRLHDRTVFTRTAGGWETGKLYP
jgi:pyridoxamine 5'-phosphate oxidase